MFSFKFPAAILLFSLAVSATSIARQATIPRSCTPALDGVNVSIFTANEFSKWGTPTVPPKAGQAIIEVAPPLFINLAANWHLAQPDGGSEYTIEAITDTSLVITASDSLSGALKLKKSASYDEHQRWNIACLTCIPDADNTTPPDGVVASGCTIRSPLNGFCATIAATGARPHPVLLEGCSSISSSSSNGDGGQVTFNLVKTLPQPR
ncbi:hypothetical protein MKEN_01112200 [Mycena kentingensis (nom. inval.)]|nr:hypothetical protein MKEN_01112200 [Mycena kentingensis (nom. inval.)]